jgi:hypothetical protein
MRPTHDYAYQVLRGLDDIGIIQQGREWATLEAGRRSSGFGAREANQNRLSF